MWQHATSGNPTCAEAARAATGCEARTDESGSYWHNGATGGFSSFATFDPANDFAVIVLFNRSVDDGPFADDLAKHVVQRLTGRPAMSL